MQICSYLVGTDLYKNLFNALEDEGISEDVYVFTHKNIQDKYQANVILAKCYKHWERYVFPLKHYHVLINLKKNLDVRKYYLMHAHSLFSNGYIAYKLHKEFGIPYVVAVRNTDVNLFFKKLVFLRRLGVMILRNASRIVFISEPYKNNVLNKYVPQRLRIHIKENSIVLPNGIDDFWLENKFLERSLPEHKKINIIHVGKVSANKNISTTIKACNLLRQEGYDVMFYIVGKIYDNEHRDLVKNIPFIKYIEHCDKRELISHYRNADILVMPSKHETFGLVYAEAMSQGLPIIYTRGQGFDGQFPEGVVGYSVLYDSHEEIARKVKIICKNYRTISQNCLENTDRFDWTEIAKEYSQLYLEVLESV